MHLFIRYLFSIINIICYITANVSIPRIKYQVSTVVTSLNADNIKKNTDLEHSVRFCDLDASVITCPCVRKISECVGREECGKHISLFITLMCVCVCPADGARTVS